MNKSKILIVDDEEELTSLLTERLKLRGYESFGATTGSEAIKMVEVNQIDIAIIDIRLKDINGLDLMKLLRVINPIIKFILFTGHGTEKEAQLGLKLGASLYLIKPVNIDRIIKEINNLLNID